MVWHVTYKKTGVALKIILACLFSVFAIKAGQAETRSVTATGKAVIDGETTLGQAQNNALNQARIRAVEQAAGVSVSNLTLMQESIIVSDLVRTFSHGFLVEESELEWRGEWVSEDNTDGPGYPVVNVKLTGKVDVLPRTFFRSHLLSASLSKKTYRSGETAVISVQSNEDMYLLVVNYTSRNRLMPVFPNRHDTNNFIRSGSTLRIPEQRQKNFELLMQNYAGHSKDTEAFLVLGFPDDEHTRELDWHALFESGKEMDYAGFFERLMALPVAWVAERTLVYSVVNK